ncbi:MAG: SMC-Scp complex subunit ScpB [Gammaproteobacteria bacterium]|nr:SMC-Scp complex subunit ScpB [Gammaproteobacteria bacterium]
MNQEQLIDILETCLLVAGRPLSLDDMQALFDEGEAPATKDLKDALEDLAERWNDRTLELVKVASGYRFQARKGYLQWVARLFEERPPKYSRATLETLAVIVYRQPVTRAVIEDVRGVSVSTTIIKTLMERGWIRIVGHRDVPGKPALYGTTKQFLDDFNMSSLTDLPPLAELSPDDHLQKELDLPGEFAHDDVAASDAALSPEAELEAEAADLIEEDRADEILADEDQAVELVSEAELE